MTSRRKLQPVFCIVVSYRNPNIFFCLYFEKRYTVGMNTEPITTTGSGRFRKNDTETRSYHYNSGDIQQLFARIIESLGSLDESSQMIECILTEVCRHFHFGCGFVYEADHTHTFHLKEQFSSYQIKDLPGSFSLEKHFNADEMANFLRQLVFYQHSDDPDFLPGYGNQTLAASAAGIEHAVSDPHASRIFDSNTLMLVPAINKDNQPIGIVGMMDRRRNIFLDDQGIKAAQMVLNLLANHIKLRFYQRSIELAEQSLVCLLDNTGVDIYVNDFYTHEILYVNKSMAAPYGGRHAMLGKPCWAALYTDKTGQCEYCPQRKLIDIDGNPTKVYSWDYRRPFDGSWFRVLSSAFHWVDGRLAHVVSSVDITENKNNEAIIAQMANYDALTNLPNRRKLMKDCQDIMQDDRRFPPAGFLLFFDLDNFKDLNDSMGHQAGDDLLREVGKTLQKNPLTKNHAYRYGGDEFIVLLNDLDRDYMIKVIHFLLNRFNQPWKIRGSSRICRASIGVAEYPDNGFTPDELLHNADMMMYKAKQNGRGMACFYDGQVIKA